jgi:hypothetical protein
MHWFFQILFWNETLNVSDNFFFHHQEFLTVQTAMVYVIKVCRQLLGRIWMFHTDPAAWKLSTNLYDMYHCWVYSEKLLMMDKGTVRNM